MSLTNSLLIGRSALTASQVAIQVTGDNLANAATPGFNRRVASLTSSPGSVIGRGIYLGRGVEVSSVSRQIDQALTGRLRDNSAQLESSRVARDILSQIELIVSDLDGHGLSSQLGEFLNSFSELANNPSAAETRALIVEQGATLAQFVGRVRTELRTLQDQADSQLSTTTARADELLREIASLNRAVVTSEQGRSQDAGLRDQRDALLSELGSLIDISVNEQPDGAVDVFVGSTPIVLGTQARGIEVRRQTDGDSVRVDIIVTHTQERLSPRSGTIGGLLAQRDGAVQESIDAVDSLAANLIFEVNKLHSSGRSFPGLTDTIGSLRTPLADRTVALNDPANTTFAGLPRGPVNGSFSVYVTDTATGLVEKHEIFVDLDGVNSAGAPGYGDDTTLESLVASLDAIGNLNAEIDAAGRVRIRTDAGFEVGFADDTSGALATLGINTFFTGQDASNIGIRQELRDRPELLVAGLHPGSNEVALAIAGLREAGVDALGGVSLLESWRRSTESVSVQTRAAGTRATASGQVQASLEAQRSAISGVSIDEESINLLNYQRQYQAAAQLISTVDEMTQILLNLV